MIMIPNFVCNTISVSRNAADAVPCDCDDVAARGARADQAPGPRAGYPDARDPAGAGPGGRAGEPARLLQRQGEHVGLTTVYRHLQALSEQGSIDAIRDASGETLYRQCGTSVHHHHLTCRNCGRSVEVEGRAVEQWAERVAAEAGFTDVGHTVELFGLCPQCAPELS